jgi:hypothetical protein
LASCLHLFLLPTASLLLNYIEPHDLLHSPSWCCGRGVLPFFHFNSPTCAHNCNRQKSMPRNRLVPHRIEKRQPRDVCNRDTWHFDFGPVLGHRQWHPVYCAIYFPLPFLNHCDKSMVDPVRLRYTDIDDRHTIKSCCVCLPVTIYTKFVYETTVGRAGVGIFNSIQSETNNKRRRSMVQSTSVCQKQKRQCQLQKQLSKFIRHHWLSGPPKK